MHVPKRAKLLNGAPSSTSATTSANSAAAVANPLSAPLIPAIPPSATSSSSPAQTFLSHILLLSTAQIASHASFTVCRRSTLAALGEIASKYIESIGVSASTAATLAGRSEVNLHDIMYGLNEMGVEFSEMRQWKDRSRIEEIPFAHTMPSFPQTQPVVLIEPVPLPPSTSASSSSLTTPALRGPHIPSVLPVFPPKRTYAHTPDFKVAAASTDASASRKRKVEENRKLESALVTLHQAATKAALDMAIEAEKELRVPPREEKQQVEKGSGAVGGSSKNPSKPSATATINSSLRPPPPASIGYISASRAVAAGTVAAGLSSAATSRAVSPAPIVTGSVHAPLSSATTSSSLPSSLAGASFQPVPSASPTPSASPAATSDPTAPTPMEVDDARASSSGTTQPTLAATKVETQATGETANAVAASTDSSSPTDAITQPSQPTVGASAPASDDVEMKDATATSSATSEQSTQEQTAATNPAVKVETDEKANNEANGTPAL